MIFHLGMELRLIPFIVSVAEMRKGIKPVRMRAGVPDFDNNIYADKDVFRIYLKRERQIELMGGRKALL